MPHGGEALAKVMGYEMGSFIPSLKLTQIMAKIRKNVRKTSEKMGEEVGSHWEGMVEHSSILGQIGDKFRALGDAGASMGNVFGAVGGFALNTIGIFMQFANAMGILDPIIKLITSVFTIMGGAAMNTLTPAIQKLAEVLFSPEMMKIWGDIGSIIGTFLATFLNMISTLLADPEFYRIITIFVQALGQVFTVIISVLGWFFEWLGSMDPSQLGALFYAVGIGLAFLIGLAAGGILGVIVGTALAVAAAIALAPLMHIPSTTTTSRTTASSREHDIIFMQHGGIVTSPTFAVIGEGGPEAVIPLGDDSVEGMIGGDNFTQKETLWATEDNGKKLDKLIMIMSGAGKGPWR